MCLYLVWVCEQARFRGDSGDDLMRQVYEYINTLQSARASMHALLMAASRGVLGQSRATCGIDGQTARLIAVFVHFAF